MRSRRLPALLLTAWCFTASAQTFPQSWRGTWRGTLQIHTVRGVTQTVPMAVEIAPTPDSLRYTFALIYGADTAKGRRPYELLVVDRAKGHYLFDEKTASASTCTCWMGGC